LAALAIAPVCTGLAAGFLTTAGLAFGVVRALLVDAKQAVGGASRASIAGFARIDAAVAARAHALASDALGAKVAFGRIPATGCFACDAFLGGGQVGATFAECAAVIGAAKAAFVALASVVAFALDTDGVIGGETRCSSQTAEVDAAFCAFVAIARERNDRLIDAFDAEIRGHFVAVFAKARTVTVPSQITFAAQTGGRRHRSARNALRSACGRTRLADRGAVFLSSIEASVLRADHVRLAFDTQAIRNFGTCFSE
jgi:hypothetical protein